MQRIALYEHSQGRKIVVQTIPDNDDAPEKVGRFVLDMIEDGLPYSIEYVREGS